MIQINLNYFTITLNTQRNIHQAYEIVPRPLFSFFCKSHRQCFYNFQFYFLYRETKQIFVKQSKCKTLLDFLLTLNLTATYLVTKSCLTLYKPMNCSMPGFSVHHHLPGFAQTHVHWVGDAIQPSHQHQLISSTATS